MSTTTWMSLTRLDQVTQAVVRVPWIEHVWRADAAVVPAARAVRASNWRYSAALASVSHSGYAVTWAWPCYR